MITASTKTRIISIVNCFETGTIEGKYDKLVKLYDGPGDIQQITYGRSQTTEFGNLKILLQDYIYAKGIYALQLQSYIDRVGKQPGLSTNAVFCKLLKDAANKDPVMHKIQDDFFDSIYYQPAFAWFTHLGFTLPLSLLVIYDSQVHSGGIPDFLRNRFAAKVPLKGGDEKVWIKQYVDVRHEWLATHKRAILRNTIYRTQCFKTQIKNDNWDLKQTVTANGVKVV